MQLVREEQQRQQQLQVTPMTHFVDDNDNNVRDEDEEIDGNRVVVVLAVVKVFVTV